MATLLNKLTSTVKKVTDAVKNNNSSNTSSGSSNTSSGSSSSKNDGSWIGVGISPRTGEPTYSTTSSSASSSKSSSRSSYDDDLQRLKRLQQEATAQQLKAQKEKTLQALADQEATIKPAYQAQRNSTAAVSAKNARSFNEYLANRGLTNSGAAVQAESNRMSTLQNNLADIDTQETNALNEIARARRNAETDYANGLATANAQIEADYFSKVLAENQRQRQIDEQLQQQALTQYSDDYQARINELLAQGYSPTSREIMQLQALRGQKIANTYSNANSYNNALAQVQSGYINYNNAAQLGMTVDQAQQYYNQIKAQQEAAAQAEAEQLAWDRYVESTKLNNDILQTQYNINKPYYSPNTSGNGNDNNVMPSESAQKNYIENTFAIRDGYDGTITGYDSQGILNYIQNENESGRMTNKTAINLLYNYGFKEIADQLSQQ